jgi:hypothetical protein
LASHLHKVEGLLLRGGGWALVVGRCTAGARVVLPGLAGMLGLRYRTFVLWTGVAATGWAAAHVLLGYAAGAGWRHIHHLTGRVGLLLAGVVLVALAVACLLHRPAKHDEEPRQPSPQGGATTSKADPRRLPPTSEPRLGDRLVRGSPDGVWARDLPLYGRAVPGHRHGGPQHAACSNPRGRSSAAMHVG